MALTVDSNITGLAYAEEDTLKTLPVTPVWYPLEPNGYDDFGGEYKLMARNPINPSRQRKKGVITDLDAKGGFAQDLTQNNMLRLLQGFFFADLREKTTNIPMNGTTYAISAVTQGTKRYTVATAHGSSYAQNNLIYASGCTNSANDGLKTVDAVAATYVQVLETCATEVSTATTKIQKVGQLFASGDAQIDASGTWPRFTSAAVTLTNLGLIVGEWVFIGGDAAGVKFATAANNGFARIRAIAAGYIEFDKTSATMVTDTGTGKTIQLFYGNVLKNEDDITNIVRRTYNIERTIGEDANGTMSEYLTGAVCNELSLQVKPADKILVNCGFVACDYETYDGATEVKAGTRPELTATDAYNTSSDFTRINLHTVTEGDANPTPLWAYMTDLTIDIKNGVSPLKAVATLGAFDMSVGTFEVTAQLTAYFVDTPALAAVRDNYDVSLDLAIVKNNAGFVFDIPLLALGDGRLKVEQDKPITIPLKADAAECTAGYTLLLNEFPYLPDAAQ